MLCRAALPSPGFHLCAFLSYCTNRLWPRLWPGEHMQDWILRLLLHRQVCAEWTGSNTTTSEPSVNSALSLPHSGQGCHYLHLDKGSCSSDPKLEGCHMYKPLANGVSAPQKRPRSRPRRCQPQQHHTVLPFSLNHRVNAGRKRTDCTPEQRTPMGRSTMCTAAASLPTLPPKCSPKTTPANPLQLCMLRKIPQAVAIYINAPTREPTRCKCRDHRGSPALQERPFG